jgi:hypothetical protein
MGEPAAIKLVRFLWAGPLTVVASPIAVSRIRTVVVMILNPDAKFLPPWISVFHRRYGVWFRLCGLRPFRDDPL